MDDEISEDEMDDECYNQIYGMLSAEIGVPRFDHRGT